MYSLDSGSRPPYARSASPEDKDDPLTWRGRGINSGEWRLGAPSGPLSSLSIDFVLFRKGKNGRGVYDKLPSIFYLSPLISVPQTRIIACTRLSSSQVFSGLEYSPVERTETNFETYQVTTNVLVQTNSMVEKTRPPRNHSNPNEGEFLRPTGYQSTIESHHSKCKRWTEPR